MYLQEKNKEIFLKVDWSNGLTWQELAEQFKLLGKDLTRWTIAKWHNKRILYVYKRDGKTKYYKPTGNH